MSFVVDASVACKWVFDEEGSPAAVEILKTHRALLAPDLLIAEVVNAAWRKTATGDVSMEQATAAIQALPGLVTELLPAARLAELALSIAVALDHPAYGCLYLALAEERNSEVVTFDRRFAARAAGSPWARRVTVLG
ncbi:MAG: type II toxin-antitoxin system VapC family toxin [Rhodospirillales bacterium]|nr:type II toxin-antitoxin system VapC family toxin [Rhodospirillales bacterium]